MLAKTKTAQQTKAKKKTNQHKGIIKQIITRFVKQIIKSGKQSEKVCVRVEVANQTGPKPRVAHGCQCEDGALLP